MFSLKYFGSNESLVETVIISQQFTNQYTKYINIFFSATLLYDPVSQRTMNKFEYNHTQHMQAGWVGFSFLQTLACQV